MIEIEREIYNLLKVKEWKWSYIQHEMALLETKDEFEVVGNCSNHRNKDKNMYVCKIVD